MAGQATVTIKNKQWNVSVAATPLELTQGLGGLPGIPAQSGMLFDLGMSQIIQVTTVPMLFPLDIAFLSDTLVITEVYRNVQPGYLVTSELPARYFLEVNAGELEGIDSSDQAGVEVLTPSQTIEPVINWMLMFGMMMAFIPFLLMGVFMVSMVRVVTDLVFEKPKEKPRLPPRTEQLKLLPRTKPTAVKSPMREPEVMRYRVEENKPYGTWAVVELWATGTVRSPFQTKEEAIKREEEIGDYFGWKLERVEFTKAQEALLDPQRFPRRTEALSRLQGHDVIEVHDDGDLTVRSRGRFYVVTTEGELFAHHTGGEALRRILGDGYLAQTKKQEVWETSAESEESPKALPREKGGYYWTAINKETGEIAERGTEYPTANRALKAGRSWVIRNWRHGIAIVEVWTSPYRYSGSLKINPVSTETVTLEPAVIPAEKAKLKPGELEYLADSPEFLTQTIDAIGYRDKIDNTFQDAIARARGKHGLTERITDGSDAP